MFHTQNTVRRSGRGKRLPDAIAEFQARSMDTIGGIRTAAARILKSTQDVDLNPCIRNALLYGPIARPIDAGDQAMLNPVPLGFTPRNIQPSGPTQHRAGRILATLVPTQIFVPPRPILLQGVTFSSMDRDMDVVWGHNQEITNQPNLNDPNPFLIVEDQTIDSMPFHVPLGIPGVLISPDTGIWQISDLAETYQVTINFTDAILVPGPC